MIFCIESKPRVIVEKLINPVIFSFMVSEMGRTIFIYESFVHYSFSELLFTKSLSYTKHYKSFQSEHEDYKRHHSKVQHLAHNECPGNDSHSTIKKSSKNSELI